MFISRKPRRIKWFLPDACPSELPYESKLVCSVARKELGLRGVLEETEPKMERQRSPRKCNRKASPSHNINPN